MWKGGSNWGLWLTSADAPDAPDAELQAAAAAEEDELDTALARSLLGWLQVGGGRGGRERPTTHERPCLSLAGCRVTYE